MLLPLGDDLERPSFPVVTVALIFINIAVFAVISRMEMTGAHLVDTGERSQVKKVLEVKEFYGTWGVVPSRLQEGELIGLLTHMFMHAGIFHLIGNLLILWCFGQSLETALGGFAFLILYIFWGVAASVAHAATDFSSEVFMIGASGAIAGVIGGYMALFGAAARIKIFLLLGFFPFKFYIPAGIFGFMWIMQQMYHASLDAEGALTGVAWMAHVGGFMVGLVTILIFRNQTDRVLIYEGQRRYFVRRDEYERSHASAPVEGIDIDLDDESYVVDIQARPCKTCGTQIDKSNLIGERLLRCPNKRCNQLAYLTDAELTPEYVH